MQATDVPGTAERVADQRSILDHQCRVHIPPQRVGLDLVRLRNDRDQIGPDPGRAGVGPIAGERTPVVDEQEQLPVISGDRAVGIVSIRDVAVWGMEQAEER